MYRFLGALQNQVAAGVGWDWGPLSQAAFLPRVTSGRTVLSRARWLIPRTELRSLAVSGDAMFTAVQLWRSLRELPRFVILTDDDEALPVDLDNVLSIEAFVHLVKGRSEAVLREVLPEYGELPVAGPEGHFVAELIVPFVRGVPSAEATSQPQTNPGSQAERRLSPPGSEWLFAKLYAGPAGVDKLLCEEFGPLAQGAVASGAAESWFFVRYGDPDWHLRLRLHGEPDRLQGEVLPALQERARALVADGVVLRMQLDTYEGETARYGGKALLALSERIFHADSKAVFAILEAVEKGDAGLEERWRLGVVGVDLLLDAFGLSVLAKRDLTRRLRSSFVREFVTDSRSEAAMARKFREYRVELEELLDPASAAKGPLARGVRMLAARHQTVAPVIAKLRQGGLQGGPGIDLTDLAASHVHMHLNRLLRSRHREQEFVIYDFLARLYSSAVARAEDERHTSAG